MFDTFKFALYQPDLEFQVVKAKRATKQGEHLNSCYRHFHIMKSRALLSFFLVLFLIAMGGIWYFDNLPEQEPVQILRATVNRDCAPWDGAAFTISFRYDPLTTITISIWKPPVFKTPVTFLFPDETGQIGVAYSLSELDRLEVLTGKVWFQRVEQGTPLEGRFRLASARGEVLEGGFAAEWGSQIVYCG